jgi:hypothetical protein
VQSYSISCFNVNIAATLQATNLSLTLDACLLSSILQNKHLLRGAYNWKLMGQTASAQFTEVVIKDIVPTGSY